MGERPNDWLNAFAGNVSSQFGEDGILARVLDEIGELDGWCVEFGAWDGVTYSNTNHLVEARGYTAVLIEADPARFAKLHETSCDDPRIVALNRVVGFGEGDNLDVILSATETPVDFDVLSIDIDGNDYHVWDAMRRYRPKVVVIEFNPTIPVAVKFVQPKDLAVTQGSSLSAIAALGKTKGYELVAVTASNAVLVDGRYFDRFGITDNRPEALWPGDGVTYLFQGFDGTIFLRGPQRLIWHELQFDDSRFQVLPRWLRRYPDSYSASQRLLLRALRRYYRARSKDLTRSE
jgi:hypothetical protein